MKARFSSKVDFRWIADESLIGTAPGLSIRPRKIPKHLFSKDSNLISFSRNHREDRGNVLGWGFWAIEAKSFLTSNYENANLTNDNSTRFNTSLLGPCNTAFYGYDQGKPCVFLKLNKIYGLENIPFNDSSQLPEDMSQNLKKVVLKQEDRNNVWVNCQGKSSNDVEDLGPMKYYPSNQGFPINYFPYFNQKGYESPLVAVQFLSPKLNVRIRIVCKAWAKNINHDRNKKHGFPSGYFEFDLQIQDYDEQI